MLTRIWLGFLALVKGFMITGGYLFRKPITIQYPEQKRILTARGQKRWRHYLLRDEAGLERCVACELCQIACPADAIFIQPEEYTPEKERISREERYAGIFEIDLGRCIFCGYCEEACPKMAIELRENFELAVFDRAELIIGKDKLVEK